MAHSKVDPKDLDDGIRDTVVLLRKAGFKTFTSCEGGRGHAFKHETIGLELEGRYSDFEKRLVKFLRAHRMQNFTVSLTTDFHPDFPENRRCVYLAGLDILSEDKRRKVIEAAKRRDRRLLRQLRLLLTIALVVCLGCGREPPRKEGPDSPTKTLAEHVVLAKHQCGALRIEAAHALGEMGAAAVPTLTELLRDKEWGVRKAAAVALAQIGPEAKTAVPALTKLLRDGDGELRKVATEALEKITREKE